MFLKHFKNYPRSFLFSLCLHIIFIQCFPQNSFAIIITQWTVGWFATKWTQIHYKITWKKVFGNINYYLPPDRPISEGPKSRRGTQIRIWENFYGCANVHRCVKKCPVRDNHEYGTFIMKNDENNSIYVPKSL